MDKQILKLLQERYFLPTETSWDDIAKRVSAIYPPIYEDIKNKSFIPSTPTLMNGNTQGQRQGTLSSCFTMDIEDSMEGIMDSLKEAALVTKAAGGVGYVFSKLRASKENIASINRESSGPIPFMRMFNVLLDGVSQGGARKGAGMGQFDINHPDILHVIRLKNTKGAMERLNISIRVTDEFYEILKTTPDAPHVVYDSKGNEFTLQDNGKIVTVKKLWDEIIEYAWLCAEPGIFNVDIATRQCTVTNVNNYVLSNPCQPAFATVLTPKGIRTIGEISIGDIIWSGKRWTKVINKWFTGNKQVNSYNTSAGSFIGTENHRIVQQGKKIEVKDASAIDICSGPFRQGTSFNANIVMDGLVIGDGSFHKASNNLVYLCIGDNDYDYFSSEIKDLILKERSAAFKYGWEVNTSITYDELPLTYNRVIPKRFYKSDIDTTVSFLRGLYSANGSLAGDRVTLKQSSLVLIKQVQEMLSSIGIRSYYTTNKSKNVNFINGEYKCKESYDLNITKDRELFSDTIGFIQAYKNDKLSSIISNIKNSNKSKNTYDISSIDDLGYHDVFDMTVEADEHTYWTGGLLVSNCAEFTNIPYASCNLGSINLTKFVKISNYNGNVYFDWEEYTKAIKRATRFLNNVIDINDFPIKKIKDITLKVRPIGLGAMGYAHMLYMLEIPYNSPEALKLKAKLFHTLTMQSMRESVNIAAENHTRYPAFDYDLFMKANKRFFTYDTDLSDPDSIEYTEWLKTLASDVNRYGAANSCYTSIAPNGSIAYIADMTTGGIEPVYALTYSRSIEKMDKQYEVVYITDPVFDAYLTANFDIETKIKILAQVANDKGSCQNVEEISIEMRKVFVVAGDLTPMEHLDSLAVAAVNTSLSVSKTINLPADATREEISEVYLKAHAQGVIGVTVYRDGCRDGILNHSVKDDKEIIVKTNAPKRPKRLPAHVYRVSILNRVTDKPEKWIIFVGLLDGDPYEIFAGKIDGKDFSTDITEGELVKTKKDGKSVYQFHSENEVLVENIQEAYLNGLREYITRIMSWGLRHGGGIEYLKEVLQKSDGTIVDFNKAIIRAIGKYCKNVASKEKCPTCNADLRYEGGCVTCSNPECSFTKCG